MFTQEFRNGLNVAKLLIIVLKFLYVVYIAG